MPETRPAAPASLAHPDRFVRRHVGPGDAEIQAMLRRLDLPSLEALADRAVPAEIRMDRPLELPAPLSERELLRELREMAGENSVWRSYLGYGYHDTITPPVIQRGVLENPGWYTQYTPYQAEISQGRLEALLNFQTVVADLTGLPMANSSMLDEATAAAEAVSLCFAVNRKTKSDRVLVAPTCHPQTIEVVRTRAEALGIEIVLGDPAEADFADGAFRAVLLQYPDTEGAAWDPRATVERAHAGGAMVIMATDLLALTLLTPPGELGADVAVGNSQRFGVPLGYGGPHAAFFATRDEFKRSIPGRIVGLSKDAAGAPALRLALQTREQHIRREKATSNICTAQVLLAIMAGFYAVYHGPDGLRAIGERVHRLARTLAAGLQRLGLHLRHEAWFDTLVVEVGEEKTAQILATAAARHVNLRTSGPGAVLVALDETVGPADIDELLAIFASGSYQDAAAEDLAGDAPAVLPESLQRSSAYLEHPVFHRYRSETELMRYMQRLQRRDLSLTTSMISLGSCTMKLNATAEMVPVTWAEFGALHPFAPREQARGYARLFEALESMLAEITGFHAVSLQPNAGSQGEYAGMLVIRAWHRARGDEQRKVCLIPQSAHGTNPASAVMAGMKVVVVACDEAGNIDLADLRAKAEKHAEELAALMVTYPSTHGVFEKTIREVCDTVHEFGGQVYLDGANLNAQVGLCRPGDYGADVCHINLHKTFCIPHGGGGPGMGPIGVAEHLAPYLPGNPIVPMGGSEAIGPISAAPWGSPSILLISYAYIRMMGAEGLTHATQVAILNANYMAKRLEDAYPVLYRGPGGLSAHEFILDLRPMKKRSGLGVEDVAKRLMDYGFHAPTISFPVIGTMMIEPTESEAQEELDRFCDAMLSIHAEMERVASGEWPPEDNPLANAPHTAREIASDDWPHPYGRETAAFPAPWLDGGKFWPPVKRADGVYGDRNLVCACPPTSSYGGGK